MTATLKTGIVQEPSSSIANLTLSSSGGVTFGAAATTNTITSAAATALTIQSAGTTAMTIDTSQNVGIGTTTSNTANITLGNGGASTAPTLTINGGTSGANGSVIIGQAGSSNEWLISSLRSITGGGALGLVDYVYGANPRVFYTNGSERMRIDSSGNVGIGTTPTSGSQLSTIQTVYGIFGGSSQININTNAYYNGGWKYIGTGYATLYSQNLPGASGTHTWSYSTSGTAGNAIAFNEAMRIDSSGNLLVGYTSSNGSYKLQVNSQIFATSSTIATSDANYKTNVTPLTGALDLVSKLNPVSFNWKQHPVHDFDTQNTTVGFLAQEVQTVLADQSYVNSIVKESEVTLLDETKEKFLGIAEGNMIAILTKAIQELSAKVDAQAAEITALQAKVGA